MADLILETEYFIVRFEGKSIINMLPYSISQESAVTILGVLSQYDDTTTFAIKHVYTEVEKAQ